MKIAFVTGSRADWNGLGMVAKAFKADRRFETVVIITGTTPADIVRTDGITAVLARFNQWGDEPQHISEAIANAVAAVGTELDYQKPDLVVLVGDRFEIFAAAAAAMTRRLPIAHLSGGDVTEGSLDDKYRNAITMMADLHFPTHDHAFGMLMQMGVNDRATGCSVVHMVGAPAIDRIFETPILPKAEFFSAINLRPRAKNIAVAYHPATLDVAPTQGCLEMRAAIIALAESSEVGCLVLGSNADADSGTINSLLQGIARRYGAFFANLPAQQYYSALTHCDLLIGNSSAGLYEAPSFGIPVVNIGNRQRGRIEAENVLTCAADRGVILNAIHQQLSLGRQPCINPYGDGQSSARIVEIVANHFGV